MSRPLPPIIKWAGSKRQVAALLAGVLPPSDRMFDPFVGGGSMLGVRRSARAIAGDVQPELVALFELVRDDPRMVVDHYRRYWNELKLSGEAVYYAVRERFNTTRDPLDFLLLSRTCTNGLIRYNASGDFNNSFHHGRAGIDPERFSPIAHAWSGVLRGVQFACADFRETLVSVCAGDVVFLDPPYAGSHGEYGTVKVGMADLTAELARLNELGARWMLTLDGFAGERTYEALIPEELYERRFFVRSGLSTFRRLMGKDRACVHEAVYVNFRPEGGTFVEARDPAGQTISVLAWDNSG